MPNEAARYSVTVVKKGKDLKVEYIWSVKNGEIIEGQGSQSILVTHLTRRDEPGSFLVKLERLIAEH